MHITSYALPVSLLLLTACPSDDGETETTNSMTSAASTSDASGTAGSSGTTGSGTTAGSGNSSSEGSTAADSTTGSGVEVCATCDPGTEICFASIFDGPTEYSCRPVPEECLEGTNCECVTPLVCPESLQSCAFEGAVMIVECVEG